MSTGIIKAKCCCVEGKCFKEVERCFCPGEGMVQPLPVMRCEDLPPVGQEWIFKFDGICYIAKNEIPFIDFPSGPIISPSDVFDCCEPNEIECGVDGNPCCECQSCNQFCNGENPPVMNCPDCLRVTIEYVQNMNPECTVSDKGCLCNVCSPVVGISNMNEGCERSGQQGPNNLSGWNVAINRAGFESALGCPCELESVGNWFLDCGGTDWIALFDMSPQDDCEEAGGGCAGGDCGQSYNFGMFADEPCVCPQFNVWVLDFIEGCTIDADAAFSAC